MSSTRANSSRPVPATGRTNSGPTTSGRPRAGGRGQPPATPWWRRPAMWIALVVVAAVAGLYIVFTNAGQSGSAPNAKGTYKVGSPSPGQPAPAFSIPSASGGTVSLADYRGKNVLLYFQEGLTCQPCWTQITDLEKSSTAVKGAGVDAVVSITTDPANLLAQKVTDEGIATTPVLSDADLTVSGQYQTAGAGMMGGQRNGHSFILVGPDGRIRWRADYGGAPNYTMYVPVAKLLADLRAGVANR